MSLVEALFEELTFELILPWGGGSQEKVTELAGCLLVL
jgi:hypothetical protein